MTTMAVLTAIKTALLAYTYGSLKTSAYIGYKADAIGSDNITAIIEPENTNRGEDKLFLHTIRVIIFLRASTPQQKIDNLLGVERGVIGLLTDITPAGAWAPLSYESSTYEYDDTENNIASIMRFTYITTI